jgi:DNA/RNA endonuclease YhcR with UshA esterase domain
MKIHITLIFILFLLSGSTAFTQRKIKAEDVKSYIGQKDTVTVVGKVFHIKINDHATFFDIGAVFPDNVFTVVIFPKNKETVGDVSKYDGKTIEMTGLVTEHNGRPEMEVSNPKQLKIVE